MFFNNCAAFQCVKIYETQMRKYEILKLRHRAYGVYLEDHPRTCRWLGSPRIYKPWSSAIWKGSHNPILRGLRIATYVRPGSPSSKYGTIAIQRKQTKQSSKQSTTKRLNFHGKAQQKNTLAVTGPSSFGRLVCRQSGTTASGEFPSNLEGAKCQIDPCCFADFFFPQDAVFYGQFLKVY